MEINNFITVTLQLDCDGMQIAIWLVDKEIFIKFNEIAFNYENLCQCICGNKQLNSEDLKISVLNSLNFFKNIYPVDDDEFFLAKVEAYRSITFFEIICHLSKVDKQNPYYIDNSKLHEVYVSDIDVIEYYGSKVGHYY